jgi:signal transduction histidine kinase
MWCDRWMRSSALVQALFRLPIRMRLTLVFVGLMALVLGAAGFFLHREFKRDLDRSIDDAQRAQVLDVAALVESARGPSSVAESGERFAQVYAADGRILGSTRHARGERLLSRAEAQQAVSQTVSVERRSIGGSDVRVRAVPGRLRSGERAVIAAGDSLVHRDGSLAALDRLLLIALPLALLIAGFAGYEVAGAALRPVDEMRRRAAEISDTNPSKRLPLPEARDEIAALGKTLNEMLGRLEQAVARERRLLNDASHELRTPLTTLRAELELALRGDRDPSELRSAIESGLEEARRISRLANDLLVLARADEGKLPLELGPEGAVDLLAAAAERAGAAAGELGRSVVVNDETRGAVVLADADRVAQALDNLLANSLRYGAGGIELKAKHGGGLIELHVLDSGAGFDEDFRAHAFERFSRDAVGNKLPSGAGLGLAIVAAIATAHGGAAGTRNRPEGGADVWLSLPEA